MGADSDTMPALAFVSTKGGLGRSTLTLGLAVELALVGYRALVVDFDPNRGCTSWMMSRPEARMVSEEETTARLILHPELGCSGIVRTYSMSVPPSAAGPNTVGMGRAWQLGRGALDFIPGTGATHQDYSLLNRMNAQRSGLREALCDVRRKYDVILLDIPSSGGHLLTEIHDAADYLVLLYDMYEARLAREDYLGLCRRVDEEMAERTKRGRPLQHTSTVRIERGPDVTKQEITRQSKVIKGPMLNTIIPYDRRAALQHPPQAQMPDSSLSQALTRLAAEVIAYMELRPLPQ